MDTIVPQEKRCAKCGETKSIENFSFRKQRNRHRSDCKQCYGAHVRERRALVAQATRLEPLPQVVEKLCVKCQQVKSIGQFRKKRGGKVYHSWCHQCMNERKNESYDSATRTLLLEYLASLPPEERERCGTEIKQCTKCERWLPYSLFGVRPDLRDGRQSWCKDCQKSP